MVTRTAQDIPGDPINVAWSDQDDVLCAMHALVSRRPNYIPIKRRLGSVVPTGRTDAPVSNLSTKKDGKISRSKSPTVRAPIAVNMYGSGRF
jgi:hypothetical protein